MIKSVQITNYLGDKVLLELPYPERTGFTVVNMDGLGPGKAEIRTTDIVTMDGGVYNSSRRPSRNIVLTLLFHDYDGKTAEELRHESYKFFPVKKEVTLIIETESRKCEIAGYVESNEPVIFSNRVGTTLSVICPYPYFYAEGTIVTVFYGTEPMFEFPFSNEDLHEPLIIFGEIRYNQEEVVHYAGDSEVGITIIIDAIGPVRNLVIHNVLTRENMFISTDRLQAMTGDEIIAGDRIIICTVQGNKSIKLLRGGIYTNIINVLDRGSDWFRLAKGDNIFAFDAEEGTTNLMFRIEHRSVYEGV